MWIKRIKIDGFGIFNNPSIPDPDPKLTVFLGDNEAGKSTLLAFIRRIFFGFPDGRSAENPYHQLSGGEYGGSIVVETAAGNEYTIERREGKKGGAVSVTLPDLSLGGEEILHQLLPSVTKDVFGNVFAFSLDELQEFSSIEKKEITDSIYSAGVGLGKKSISTVKNDLVRRAEDLFKTRGQKPEINKLFSELADIRKQQRELLKNVDDFDNLNEELEALKRLIEDRELHKADIDKRHNRVTLLAEVYEDWVELTTLEDELDRLERIEEFPPDGRERLLKHQEKQEALQSSLTEIKREIAETKDEIESITVDERITEHTQKIDNLFRGIEHIDNAVNDLPLRNRKLESEIEGLRSSLKNIGPSWTEEKLKEFDLSISSREKVREFKRRIQNAEAELNKVESVKELAQSDLQITGDRVKDAESDLKEVSAPTETDKEKLIESQKLVGRAGSLIPRIEGMQDKLEIIEDRIEEVVRSREELEEASEGIRNPVPNLTTPVLAVIGLVMAIALGAFYSVGAGIISGVLIVSTALGAWVISNRFEIINT